MAPDTTTAPSGVYSPSWRSELSADDDFLAEASETSSSDESSPFPTMVRTAARHLESHLLDSSVGEKLESGRTKAQTQALNQEAAVLVITFGPDQADKIFQGLAPRLVRTAGGPAAAVAAAAPAPHRARPAAAIADAAAPSPRRARPAAGVAAAAAPAPRRARPLGNASHSPAKEGWRTGCIPRR